MTSELHWVDFKTEVDNQMKKTVVKKDSYSSDSLEDFCEGRSSPVTDQSKTSSDENFDLDTNNEKSLSQTSSEISSVQDSNSITSTYSFEIVEETEALQIDNITEAIDIRISPRNSTVMSFNCSNNFYSEFSLVANVEVKIPDANENFDDAPNENEPKCVDIKTNGTPNGEVMLKCEGKNEIKYPEIQAIDINANGNENVEEINQLIKDIPDEKVVQKKPLDMTPNSASICDSSTPKKTGYYANKIEITKKEKKVSTSVEKKIAEEIKEMKEREEDLRVMREKLAKEISEKVTAKKDCNSEAPPQQPKPDKVAPSSPNCDQNPVIKASPIKVENTNYIKACVFAIKKKDASFKNDVSETTNKPPSAITQQETPVQREIRIAKEREEELRREREQALKSKMEMDSFNSESANETDADSALSICSDSSFDSVSKLAPLFPRTVSPELSNSNGISLYSSSAGSVCSLDSLSQRERQTTGYQSVGGSINDSILSLSPDSSYSKPGFPFASSRISSEKRSKSVDMERFISSKGKEVKFKGDNTANVGAYYEIKPPQIKKGEEMTCKRFVTAAAKIQNELREMQEREEQFK